MPWRSGTLKRMGNKAMTLDDIINELFDSASGMFDTAKEEMKFAADNGYTHLTVDHDGEVWLWAGEPEFCHYLDVWLRSDDVTCMDWHGDLDEEFIEKHGLNGEMAKTLIFEL